jgi:hypothetical protein
VALALPAPALFIQGAKTRERTMKTAIATLVSAFLLAGHAGARAASCSAKGHRLYGRVQVVTSHPDLRVRVVRSLPELRVQQVDSFPNACGRWQLVDSFPDLRIQMVDSFADLTIQWVDALPGIGGGL